MPGTLCRRKRCTVRRKVTQVQHNSRLVIKLFTPETGIKIDKHTVGTVTLRRSSSVKRHQWVKITGENSTETSLREGSEGDRRSRRRVRTHSDGFANTSDRKSIPAILPYKLPSDPPRETADGAPQLIPETGILTITSKSSKRSPHWRLKTKKSRSLCLDAAPADRTELITPSYQPKRRTSHKLHN